MKPNSYNPRVEPLEDRTLMSTCHVTRLSDSGVGKGFRGDLRYCINKVNAEPGPDVIDFHVTGTIGLNSALPNLAGELVIAGPGADMVTIDARQNARVLFVEDTASIEISGLTLTGGQSDKGAGVFNAGSLVLRESSIVENVVPAAAGQAGDGAGIYNTGTLWLWTCSVSENTNRRQYANGGGIANLGTLFVYSSQIRNNSASDDAFSAISRGGGVFNKGTATIIGSAITWNFAGGGYYGAGGGMYNEGGEVTVSSSLIDNNSVLAEIAWGGGIYQLGGSLNLTNSTLSQNSARRTIINPNTYGQGGGILLTSSSTVTVSHSTIANNHADTGGGGVAIYASLSMSNTIIAGNDAPDGNDLDGSLSGSGYNLIGNSAGGSGYADTDLLDIDPLLGTLADNGGLTFTHALLPGSPAIDAGDNTDAPEWDQRGPGFPRIVNGTIDIGAFEVQASPLPSSQRHGHDILALILATADLEALA